MPATLWRPEHRDASEHDLVRDTVLGGIGQHRHGLAVLRHQVEGDFLEESLHAEQGGEVGFVEDAAGHVE